MTTKSQMTQEEEALVRLLDKAKKVLSDPARDFLSEAMSAAYADILVHNCSYQPEEYEEAIETMHSAAVKLTGQDRELLTEVMRAYKAASASIDPDDRTHLGYRVYQGDYHWYYRIISGMVEETLGEHLSQ
jgi:hypothetical protein